MFSRVAVFSALLLFCALSVAARSEDKDIVWRGSLQSPQPQAGLFTNATRDAAKPFVLPDLYMTGIHASQSAPAVTSRFSAAELGSLNSITGDLTAAPAQATKFDVGLSVLSSATPSAVRQPASQNSQSPLLLNNQLGVLPSPHDVGLTLGDTSQFSLPASYLNDRHQFLNR